MTTEPSKAPPLYPKTHLLAASGIAALLSLALLVFPSSDVEAKRTSLSLDLESPVEQLTQDQDASDAQQATTTATESPFAQIESSPEDTQQAAKPAPAPAADVAKNPQHREVIVAKGDTLSTLFEKVGLPAATVNEVLASDKQAKQFTQLKHGQKLEFELTPDGQLNNLHSNISDLESITLTKGHRHLPEIRQGLRRAAGKEVGLTFVPHLTPMIRGIHSTLYATVVDRSVDLQALFEKRYANEPFVDVMPAGSHPETRSVRGANVCRIAVHRPQDGDLVVVLSVIDNLVKGASGQAVQNMNILFGLDEKLGLSHAGMLP